MISRDEARQLRGVAELIRGRPSPAVLEHVAAMLDELAADGTRATTPDERQCDLDLGLSPHPEAVRSRRRRASPVAEPVTAAVRPVATGHPSPSQDPDPPTLKMIRKDPPATATDLTDYDPELPPEWLLADADELRPDLPESDVRDMWRSFCDHVEKRRFRHVNARDLRNHLRIWLRKEDAEKRRRSREAYRAAAAAAQTELVYTSPEQDDDLAEEREAETQTVARAAAYRDLVKTQYRDLAADIDFDFAAEFQLRPPPEPRGMSA